jgi:hypothetical protein
MDSGWLSKSLDLSGCCDDRENPRNAHRDTPSSIAGVQASWKTAIPINPPGLLPVINVRTREGLLVAKAKGRLKGKPPKLSPAQEAHW